jgi:outer membrane protein assembly factor BamE (lipoprotein component of BamABCDE complex)
MNAFRRFGTTVAALALLAGCSTGSIGVKSDVASHPFEVGKTTRTEVVNTIGLPQSIEKDDAGNDHYYYERTAHLTGMCLGCGYVNNTGGAIPAAAIDSSQAKAKKNAVEFVFNPTGTLVSGN